MAATWRLNFFVQLIIFFLNSLKPGVYRLAESFDIVRFHVRPKTRLRRLRRPFWFINLNESFFFKKILWSLAYYMFSGSVNRLALSVFVCDWKRGYGDHFGLLILINLSIFQNSLETWHIGSLGLWVHWHCPFSCTTENEAMTAMLNFIFNLKSPC